MAVVVTHYEKRIKKLLIMFLEPNYQITNEAYLNILLSHLSGKDNKELGKSLLNLPVFTEWLEKAVTYWEDNSVLPTPSVATFTLHLISYLSAEENRFRIFNEHNVYIRFCKILKVKKSEISPSIKLAFVKMLTSFLEHKSGIEWLTATDYWQYGLKYCLTNQTIFITREGHNFIFNLLAKCVDHNEVFCSIIAKRIMAVISEVHLENGVPMTEVNDEHLQKKVTPTVQLVARILELYLESESFKRRDYRVPTIFIKNYNLGQGILNVLVMTQNEELSFNLNKVLLLLHLVELFVDSEKEQLQVSELRETGKKVFKLLDKLITKRGTTAILKLCHLGIYYWRIMNPANSKCALPEKEMVFENQMIIFQLMPVFVLSNKYCDSAKKQELDADEIREDYVQQLVEKLCPNTIRLAYSFRNHLTSEDDSFDIARKAISYMSKSRQYYDRRRGITIFQSLIYVFKDIVNLIKENPAAVGIFETQVNFLSALMGALATFVMDFEITWRESVETICITGLVMEFISLPNWKHTIIVHALKLLNLSIVKFMSPNLALLIENTPDSSITAIGPMLYSRLHDMNWEVRDSTLEVLHTIFEIAHTKFPPFQKIVLDSGLVTLVTTMSTSDGESFVRASAVKCLQEAIKIPEFWSTILEHDDLPLKMMSVLHSEPEGIVRCQVATLMCRINEYQSFEHGVTDKVYETMVHATTEDLHWEVKLNSLCFWYKVIKNNLTHQGMIDGSFPSVTFSKDKRKIVTLTDTEIQSRLNKVLQQLSECGCLGVLVAAAQDDCDVEVAKKAVNIIKELAELLNSYNISSKICDTVVSTSLQVGDVSPPSVNNCASTAEDSDKVIDEILNSRDINLLSYVYSDEDNMCVDNRSKKCVNRISPEVFLSFIQSDLNSLILERSRWLENIDDLGSLLDDMLQSYDSSVNTMDCY